ncbi:MAG TPA: class I SAM-dependent methyltransferase [Vicinamibacterales bacterium]|nr:class I SAM-dependent methyltransferase [Vicinamibacterales bacterium]
MTTPFTYEFGYSWPITWGLLVPLALFGGLAVLGIRLRWRRPLIVASTVIAVWAVAALFITHFVFRLSFPLELPTQQFLSSGGGRVVDIGAGSGRAAIGLLLAKPRATVTAVDIYKGYFGIDDNTPERFMRNATIAGVADRAETKVGDARELPFETGSYDAAISLAAIDHVPRADIPKALSEAARVLKPDGEFLLMIVNVDGWARFASPHAIGHHPRANADRWRTMLGAAGFDIVEQGTQPAMLYFLTRKRSPSSRSPS